MDPTSLQTVSHGAVYLSITSGHNSGPHLAPNMSCRGHFLFITAEICYDFSYFVFFTYVFSLFLEVSHGAAALTHSTAVVLTHSAATLV